MTSAHHVVFLVFDDMKMLDVTGPAEVFAEANRLGATYDLAYVSPSGAAVTTSVGLRLPVDGDADAVGSVDTVVVSGGDSLPVLPIPPELVRATQILHDRARRTVSICTGSFVLAAAGLLRGRRATTHWRHAELLARAYPETDVLPDALFVQDRDVHTSAGVSAGIDLALALVQADDGPGLARDVARNLVMFMQRPGGQSQFAAPLQGRAPTTPAVHSIIDLVSAEPALDHSVASM
ncbi:MAG: AraC family transcriptional regulator, partial [Phycicoccus sp.]|uniref:GlxA family transcriptional regulator n=1 Tax=Phycicoccus sp. TaxID=1902410 RepID=UPI0025896325